MLFCFEKYMSSRSMIASIFLVGAIGLFPAQTIFAAVPVIDDAKLAGMPAAQRAVIEGLYRDIRIIPQGKIQMGNDEAENDDERPARQVTVASFGILAKEITFAQYDVFAKATQRALPDDHTWGREDRPVINVSWEDARDFALWLTAQTGFNWRLPSEAEWEYAARVGSSSLYSFGDQLVDFCTYGNVADSGTQSGWRNRACKDGFVQTAPVGKFKPNAWGVHDMHGNVWEWVQDCWQTSYRNLPEDGNANEEGRCRERVQRGGSWFYGPEDARAGYRSKAPFADKSVQVGIRLAVDLSQ
jgi:formylglycine-generating enzyme required for sulfatase activity